MEQNYKKIIYDYYHSYHAKHLYGEVTIESIRKQFTFWKYYFNEFLSIDKSAAMLDTGCGNGGFVLWLTELGFINVTGIDLSKEMIEIGKSLKVKNIFQGDIFPHLQENQNTYDLIFCRDVLEHLNKTDVIEIFRLFYSSLKTNGRLIIQVPNGYSPNYGKIFYSDITHETVFSAEVLNQIALSTGYKEIYVKEISPIPHGVLSTIRFVLWKLLRIKFKLNQLIETGSAKGFFSQNIIVSIFK